MRRQGQLRASDADRDAIVERLRKAAGEGRIDAEELEERVDAALRARTYGELEWLTADLPRTDVARRHRPRGGTLARSTVMGAGMLAAVIVAVAAIAVVAFVVFAAAAWWGVCVALWIVCRGVGRRRSAWL
jgi:Domain of unknown function (DUF1707)